MYETCMRYMFMINRQNSYAFVTVFGLKSESEKENISNGQNAMRIY